MKQLSSYWILQSRDYSGTLIQPRLLPIRLFECTFQQRAPNTAAQVQTRLINAVSPLTNVTGAEPFRLPPLILHPFSAPEDTSVLMEGSRASLALQGFVPREEQITVDELDGRLLRGRYAELRMLYYIGKDLSRWAEQCAETVLSSAGFEGRRVRPETFTVYLVQHIPAHIRQKLEAWGVLDHCSLFRRAVGLHGVFQEMPPAESFAPDFLRRYHRHVDHWYDLRVRDYGFDRAQPEEFTFELYASGEYALMLEQSWGANSTTTS